MRSWREPGVSLVMSRCMSGVVVVVVVVVVNDGRVTRVRILERLRGRGRGGHQSHREIFGV